MVPSIKRPRAMAAAIARCVSEAERYEALAVKDPDRADYCLRQAVMYREKGAYYTAQLRHAERCLKCGRSLSDPKSCADGVGPECRRQVRRAERVA